MDSRHCDHCCICISDRSEMKFGTQYSTRFPHTSEMRGGQFSVSLWDLGWLNSFSCVQMLRLPYQRTEGMYLVHLYKPYSRQRGSVFTQQCDTV